MSGSAEPSAAELVAELEARTPSPLTWLVLATADAAETRPPPFLARGLVLRMGAGSGIVERHPFGAPLEPPESETAGDLPALVATPPRDGGERVIFTRNRFLLPRLASRAPEALRSCRAVLVPLPAAGDARLDGDALALLLAPFGLRPGGTGQTASGTTHALFARPADSPLGEVLESDLRFEGGTLVGEVRLDRPAAFPCHACLFAGEVPVGIGAATPGATPDRVRVRLWAAPELLSAAEVTVRLVLTRLAGTVEVRRLARPTARRFVADALLAGEEDGDALKRPCGVLLLARPDEPHLPAILRGLADQGAAPVTHLRLDGPGGEVSDRIVAQAAALGFADLAVHAGVIGPDKLAVQGLWHMARAFRRVVVLDGSESPAPDLVATLAAALDGIAGRSDVAAVRDGPWAAPFASRWATTADRLAPLARQLAFLFSLEEADYRRWTREDGGDGTDRFAWADALSRLIARAGLRVVQAERGPDAGVRP